MAAKKTLRKKPLYQTLDLAPRKLLAKKLERIVKTQTCGRGKNELLGICVFATMGCQKDLDILTSVLRERKVVTTRKLNEMAERYKKQTQAHA